MHMCTIVNNLSQNLCFVNYFQSVSAFCYVIQLLHILVPSPFFSVSAKCSTHQCFLTNLSPLLSIHPLIYPKREKEREYASRKLLSHTVQEGDSMSKIKQCSLTTQWMHSVSLPPSSFLPLHSLDLSISSIPPPPLLLFLHFQSAVTLVYAAWIPLQPSKPYQPK